MSDHILVWDDPSQPWWGIAALPLYSKKYQVNHWQEQSTLPMYCTVLYICRYNSGTWRYRVPLASNAYIS